MSIHIKKKNRGKFTVYKKRTGKTTAECLHSKNPHVRQMANFARNAKKWKHPDGGEVKPNYTGIGINFMNKPKTPKYEGDVMGQQNASFPITRQQRIEEMVSNPEFQNNVMGAVYGSATGQGLTSGKNIVTDMRFKPDPNKMYRGLGETGYKDALNSKVFRAAPNSRTGIIPEETYFAPHSEFNFVKEYGEDYIAEVPKTVGNFQRTYPTKEWSQFTTEQIPIDMGRILKKDFLRGYVPVKYKTGGEVFDSSKGTLLEKGTNPVDVFNTFGGTSDINKSFNSPYSTSTTKPSMWDNFNKYGSSLSSIANLAGNLSKNDYSNNSLNAFNNSSILNNDAQRFNENYNLTNQIGNTGASLFKGGDVFSQLGESITNTVSPNQMGEKSNFGAWFTGAIEPEKGFTDLISDIKGEKKFQGKDLLAFLVPGLNTMWDNNELKDDIAKTNLNEAHLRQASANASWQGYGRYGMRVPFATGGLTPYGTDIEIEDGETIRNPLDGSMVEFEGPTHEQGGINVTAEPGTQVFGKLKVKDGKYKGMQYKDAASILRKKIAALEKQLAE